jgi:hypothetical protein
MIIIIKPPKKIFLISDGLFAASIYLKRQTAKNCLTAPEKFERKQSLSKPSPDCVFVAESSGAFDGI